MHCSASAVVDWNPSGLNIFSVYKHGSPDRGGGHCLPDLQWLAVRAEMLHGIPDETLQVRACNGSQHAKTCCCGCNVNDHKSACEHSSNIAS